MLKAFHIIKLHKEGEIQRTVYPVDIVLVFNAKLLTEYLEKPLIYGIINLETHYLTPAALIKLFLYLFKKIRCLLFVDTEVGISHYPEHMGRDYLIVRKKQSHITLNDFFQQYENSLFLSVCQGFLRKLHKTWQGIGHLYHCKLKVVLSYIKPGSLFMFLAGNALSLYLLGFNQGRNIQSPVKYQREWS